MPLTLLLAAPAWADRLYWTAPPSEKDLAAAARTLPDAEGASLDTLVAGPTPAEDPAPALDTLRRELDAVRPLASQFDGELQIMARLQKAVADVHRLRDPADAELLWRAMVFQGNAVHRYFQDKLATDPAAAPYRVGDSALVAAWVDAVGIAGPRAPFAEDLPDPAQRLAFDEVRAAAQVMPAALVQIGPVASGASIRLDGQVVDPREGVRMLVVPGRHLFHIEAGGVVLLHADVRLKPNDNAILTAPFGPSEKDALVALAQGEGWEVPTAARVPIGGAGEPVYLGVPGRPRLLRVDGTKAESVAIVPEPRAERPLLVRAAIGGGWMSSGDFFLLNVDAGAPYTAETVNAGTAGFSVGAEARFGMAAAGLGVDAQFALGDHHSLPTGTGETRAFVHPHLAVGLPWVQATAGYLFPWHLGVGLKAHLPLFDRVEAFASGVYGLGLDQDRGADPAFSPQPIYGAWGGVAYRVP